MKQKNSVLLVRWEENQSEMNSTHKWAARWKTFLHWYRDICEITLYTQEYISICYNCRQELISGCTSTASFPFFQRTALWDDNWGRLADIVSRVMNLRYNLCWNLDDGPGSPHYSDVIMSTIPSQIASVPLVCSTVGSGAGQRIHQSSASLAFVRGIHRWPVNSSHKRPVTQKIFPFDDIIMDVEPSSHSHHKLYHVMCIIVSIWWNRKPCKSYGQLVMCQAP